MDKTENPRIIAGSAKNIRLKVSEGVRPVTDRMKQSVFDSIPEYISGAQVLDLYAGSGSFGLEALSRGSASCTFVENEKEVITTLNENIAKTHLADKAVVMQTNVGTFLKKNKDQTYDLIFCDPPFHTLETFSVHRFSKLMHAKSLMVIKLPSAMEVKPLKIMPTLHVEKFGQNQILFLGKSDSA
jgi:16S rRNA (guanine966-N2)-methyltransferase